MCSSQRHSAADNTCIRLTGDLQTDNRSVVTTRTHRVLQQHLSHHLCNRQHSLDDFLTVSHRQDLEVTAEESGGQESISLVCRKKLTITNVTIIVKSIWIEIRLKFVSWRVFHYKTLLCYLCWISDRIPFSLFPMKGAYNSRKQFRWTCVKVLIVSVSPESSILPETAPVSISKNAVPMDKRTILFMNNLSENCLNFILSIL